MEELIQPRNIDGALTSLEMAVPTALKPTELQCCIFIHYTIRRVCETNTREFSFVVIRGPSETKHFNA